MRDQNEGVRRNAMEALKKMGEKAWTNEVISALANAICDKNEYVRNCASEALGNMGEKAATNEVIRALLNACVDIVHVSKHAYLSEDVLSKSLVLAMCSYEALRRLDVKMVAKLNYCVRELDSMDLTSMPVEHLLKIYVSTENDGWLPLIAYGALLQGIALTAIGNTVKIYFGGGTHVVNVCDDQLMKNLVGAFSRQAQVLKGQFEE
ncbi:unnamed protein product [Rotaria socialis]|uniref:Uncharacterized protein n=1 Tax=Rotaria socialis TaxID=392032 RepID=A0A817VV63_9BILA|nr:unnamed protein product [Rotaria socialis]